MTSASRPSLKTERAKAAETVVVVPAAVLEAARKERERRLKAARTILDDDFEEMKNGR